MSPGSRLSRLRPSGPLGIAALGVALVLLLALVAAAARAHHTPGGAPGVHQPPAGVGDYVFSIGAVVMVSAFLFFLYLWFSERDMLAQRRQQKRGTSRALIFIVVVALAASLASRFHFLHRPAKQERSTVHPGQRAATKRKGTPPTATRPPEFKWLPVMIATAAGMVLLGVIGVRHMRRERRGLEDVQRLELELESLLDDTLADLYAVADPREAIIAAYGRMERLFASYGIPREPSEAPIEYLNRALFELRASGSALARLTDLFQQAKFSTHDVGPAMRDDAIHALTLVRDELKSNRIEDDKRRRDADALARERAAAGSEARTYGENPFETVGDKVRGDVYSGR